MAVHRNPARQISMLTWATAVMAALVIVIAVSLMHTQKASAPTNRTRQTTCQDYASRSQAQLAFLNGASWLDGDHDGVVCEGMR